MLLPRKIPSGVLIVIGLLQTFLVSCEQSQLRETEKLIAHASILASGDLSKGNALAPYIGPGPPPKTRDHRYIFLLYKQPRTQADFGTLAKESNNWDFKAFVNQHDLELIGVNFFISRNDDN